MLLLLLLASLALLASFAPEAVGQPAGDPAGNPPAGTAPEVASGANPSPDLPAVAATVPTPVSGDDGPSAGPPSVRDPGGSVLVPPPLRVELGFYLLDAAKLDMRESEFFADFYIWYKVPGNASPAWTPENIEFMNGTVEFASPLASETMSDGRVYWSRRVKGRFRGHFNLSRYPFDVQDLPIVLEDSGLPSSKLVFALDGMVPSDVLTWIDPQLNVPDWKVSSASLAIDVHTYASGFGLATESDDSESKYARVTFAIRLDRLFMPHMIKFIIPLLVIAGMAYMVFWINFAEFESQCAICVTSLLSAVALHISTADALPAVGYLVIADKIFIMFYLVIFSALVQTVIANNMAKAGRDQDAQCLDARFRVAFPAALVFGTLIIILTA